MNRTKKIIFQAAVKAFSNSGYDGATMDEIAANGGLAKGTLYYHFSSKYEIFEYIINQGISIFIDKTQEAMSREKEASEKIRVLCRVQLNLLYEYKDFFKVIMSEIWGLESGHLHIREIIKKYINNIEIYLKEAMDSGIIAKGETSYIAYSFLANIWSAVAYEVINKNMTNIDEVMDNIMTNILCVAHYNL
jgi:TetR/AcrR family transcriptional regulator